MTTYFVLFWIFLILVCGAAAVWGGKSERAAAVLYAGAAVLTLLVRPALQHRYEHVEIAVLTIDVGLLIGLSVVTVRSRKWWPTCATALQALTVLAHVGKLLNPLLWRYGYQLMAVWSAVPSLLPLAFGIISTIRDRSRTSNGT
jgi:uncharacterized membrane protein